MELVLLRFVAGLVMLIVGADTLVRGAARLAAAVGVSSLVIGLTVVAFGTSAPEFAVGIQSTLAGSGSVALGNVVGSNIFNVLFVLGLASFVSPLVVQAHLVRIDVPVMIGVSVVVLLLGLNGRIGRFEGVALVVAVVVYTVLLIRMSRGQGATQGHASERRVGARGIVVDTGLVVLGLGLLVLGARWLLHGAVALAGVLGVSELVIGLTIVAVGTSLPEVATSVAAGLRGERDIAVGNVVGSNIFNLLLVLGAAAASVPDGVTVSPGALTFDIPVMLTVSVACLPIFFTGFVIARWEGAVFLGYYVAYTLILFLQATRHDAAEMLEDVILLFVAPLTLITLGVIAARERSRRLGRRKPGGLTPD